MKKIRYHESRYQTKFKLPWRKYLFDDKNNKYLYYQDNVHKDITFYV